MKKLQKWLLSLSLCMSLILTTATPALANTLYGDEGWSVEFTQEEKMVSNFTTNQLSDAISGLQPGDNVIVSVALKNSHQETTDWYMANEVLESLEDQLVDVNGQQLAVGGAYSYRLVYINAAGAERVLYDSDTVGGDEYESSDEQGLHEATNALAEYFFLDTLVSGQTGTITLEVGLDGETQGNDYQDTLAQIVMNFAVELRSTTPNTPTHHDVPTTGDTANLLPMFIGMAGSGAILLVLAIVLVKRNKKEKEELASGKEGN